jgi:hypothetical protein
MVRNVFVEAKIRRDKPLCTLFGARGIGFRPGRFRRS